MPTERSVKVRILGNASDFNKAMLGARQAVRGVRQEIDTTNDRTVWLAQSVLALGPTFIPLGAAATPVLSGIAAQLTVGAAAAGTMALAFVGVGDALGALNKYQLEPSADNLNKLNEAMGKLGPDGADFVKFLDRMGEQLKVLQLDSRAGMFPGMTDGIKELMTLLPQVRVIVSEIAKGIGGLSRRAGEGLSGAGFEDFFNYLETDARTILVEMGRTFGNFVEGFAAMIAAFGPLTADYSQGFLKMSQSFAEWAHGLSDDTAFIDFISYVREAAPLVMDFFDSLVDAFVQVTEAAGPVGDMMLPLLSGFLDIISAIADTPLGPTILGIAALSSAFGRLIAISELASGGVFGKYTKGIKDSANAAKAALPSWKQLGGAMESTMYGQRALSTNMTATSRAMLAGRNAVTGFAKAAGPATVQAGLLALALTGTSEKLGLNNTVMGGMIGSTIGPWGTAVGVAVGATLDFVGAVGDTEEALRRADAAMDTGSVQAMSAELVKMREHLKEIDPDDTAHYLLEYGQRNASAALGQLTFGLAGNKDALNDWDQEVADSAQKAAELTFAIRAAKRESDGYSETVKRSGLAAVEAAYGIDALVAAIKRQQDQSRAATDAEFAWGQAVIDARAQVKEGTKGIDEFTKAGQANYGVLKGLGDAWNSQKESVKNSVAAYESHRQTFLDFAHSLGIGKQAAEDLADELLDVPKRVSTEYAIEIDERKLRTAVDAYKSLPPEVRTDIRANGIPDTVAQVDRLVKKYKLTEEERKALITLIDHASGRIQVIIDKLKDVKDKDVTVTTTYKQILSGKSRGPTTPNNPSLEDLLSGNGADGMTVPGSRYPYRDSRLILAAPTEEVVSNRYGGADKNRFELKAASRGAKLGIVGFADGGTVGGNPPPPRIPPSIVDAFHMADLKDAFQIWERVLRREAADREKHPAWWLLIHEEMEARRKDIAQRLREAEKREKIAQRELDRAQEVLDGWREAIDSLAETVKGKLGISQLFGETGTLGSILQAFADQTDRSTEAYKEAVALLKFKGLKDEALTAFLEQATAQQVIDSSTKLTSDQVKELNGQIGGPDQAFNDLLTGVNNASALASQYASAVLALKRLGLTEDALAAFLNEASPQQVIDFANSLSTEQVTQLNDAFSGLLGAQENAGDVAGQAAYGDRETAAADAVDRLGVKLDVAHEQVRQQTHLLEAQNRRIERLEATNTKGHHQTKQAVDKLAGKVSNAGSER